MPKIEALIHKIKGYEDDTLDIFQEAVIVLFRQVKMHKMNEVANLDVFLYRFSKNLFLDKLRQRNRFVEFNNRMDSTEEPSV